jgi:uncharacterized iron-regulated membrane protein
MLIMSILLLFVVGSVAAGATASLLDFVTGSIFTEVVAVTSSTFIGFVSGSVFTAISNLDSDLIVASIFASTDAFSSDLAVVSGFVKSPSSGFSSFSCLTGVTIVLTSFDSAWLLVATSAFS